jgi:hypothetical protein
MPDEKLHWGCCFACSYAFVDRQSTLIMPLAQGYGVGRLNFQL